MRSSRPAMALQRVGFIGLGSMGGPMAARLLKGGVRVSGHDAFPGALDALRAHPGFTPAATPAAAAAGADAVLSMVQSGAQARAVHLGGGVLDALPRGALVVDCSSVEPAA